MTLAPADDELASALGVGVVVLERAPYGYATSTPLEEVRVRTAAGAEHVLILKVLDRERMLGQARTTKPEFLWEPRREIDTYRRILTPAGIGPQCVASGERWLVVDKVPGVELWQIGDHAVWERVAGWLGGVHARFTGRGDELRAASPHLLDHSADWYTRWAGRAREALERGDDPRAAALAHALAAYDAVGEALAAQPRTLVHGELYPSNVMVVDGGPGAGIFPVDWEMAAVGPGAVDLAALAGGFAPAERSRLERAYLAGLGAGADEEREFVGTLTRARLHLALQWLGWSSAWRPPREHAQDWLGEALALTEELGLR